MNKPTVLVILDGFGYSPHTRCNAMYQAKMPHYKQLLRHYPHTLLQASGNAVGLVEGFMGNSEVGHLTIGSGRVIKQPITLIHEMIDNKTFFKHPLLISKFNELRKKNKTLHLMGLLSNAGIHGHIKHLFAFLDTAKEHGITQIVVHAFLDGRDVPPQSAATYLEQLATKLDALKCGIIGSLHGRFYAMDRDGNWQRTKLSYEVLTKKQPLHFHQWQKVLDYYYAKNVTDEFILPTQLSHTVISDDDGIIFFNVRPDRARQLTACFVDPQFDHFPVSKINLSFFITPVPLSTVLKTDALIHKEPIHNTLKEVLDHAGKTIFSIAETEKYAHVTYFFNGGKEAALPHEQRILIPSLHPKNYVDYPAMSASAITQAILESLKTDPKDFYVINYANADMVGHSGNLKATIAAVECLDEQIQKLYEQVVLKMKGTLYITADHGNAEEKCDAAGQPKTSHTTNPVPFLMVSPETKDKSMQLPLKELADIAPFILQHMGLKIPQEMK
jgi:2,3-bisphosphoglycerate-independent phosphoglycerate mutase